MCAGNRLAVAGRHLFQGNVPDILVPQVLRPGCQTDEVEIQKGVVDQIVAFVGQVAVDVGDQLAALLQRQRTLEQIDVQDAADLLHIVALSPGRLKKAPLDPVLNGVGFQSGDAGHLTEGQSSRQKKRPKYAENS